MRSRVLDSYIDKVVAELNEDVREERKKIVAERKGIEGVNKCMSFQCPTQYGLFPSEFLENIEEMFPL